MKNRNGYEVEWSSDVPKDVIHWLESAYRTQNRIRVFYGDTDRPDFERVHGRKPVPGNVWQEEYGVSGRVGVSGGTNPIPLMIVNSRSHDGGSIMADCIVRIIKNGREVYRHPNYHNDMDNAVIVPSDMQPEYSHNVTIDGEVHARFRSEKSAVRYLSFMQGKRQAR